MNNQKSKIRVTLAAFVTTAFVIVCSLCAASEADAQRRFEAKSVEADAEVRNFAQFAQELVNFIKQAEAVESNANAPEAERRKLQDLGRRITDGTSNARSNLQSLIAKIKKANRWTDEFDAEFLDSISNARVKALIRRVGGARKALTEAEAALNTLRQDVDATINESKKAALFDDDEDVFVNASFGGRRAGKIRVKCVLLGVGVAVAEVGRLKLTAENLDNLFDSNKCGGAAPTT